MLELLTEILYNLFMFSRFVSKDFVEIQKLPQNYLKKE